MATSDEDFSFPTTTNTPPFFESPPLWQHLSTASENCNNYKGNKLEEGEERFNLFLLQELKGRSGVNHKRKCSYSSYDYDYDYYGCDEKMDVLWENLNEDFSSSCDKLMEQNKFDPLSPARDVKMSCVRIKGLKLSKANGILLSGLKPSILVFIEVLKKIFVMHNNSRRNLKKCAWRGMLGLSVVSPILTFDSKVNFCSYPDSASATTNKSLTNVSLPIYFTSHAPRRNGIATLTSKEWKLHSTTLDAVLSDEDKKTWESCRQALSDFGFANEEEDKILGKAFGQIHSPYWGEERKKEVPKLEVVSEILSYLKDLGLTDDDLGKILKKFPEVLGCSLDNEMKTNVQILEKEWGIKGKTLRNLLLRNPRVLGYNIDCKGDCEAQCTRCWARF